MEKQGKGSGHIVLVPCPLQGHITPMLHLAKLLHHKGFNITILLTKPISPISCDYPEFKFLAVDVSFENENELKDDVMLFLFALNVKSKAPFRDCLEDMQSNSDIEPVLCIIYDAVMYFSADIADELKVPRIVLRTSSAATFMALYISKQIGCIPIQERHQLDEPLAEFPVLRIKDMPVFNTSYQVAREKVLSSIHCGTKTASAIIWNSLSCLEETTLDKVKQTLLVQIFPVGPLHEHSGTFSSSILTEEESCIDWLDSQTPNSVIYVSTGSLVTMSEGELVEMAWGLANSDQPFLWVIRAGLIKCSNGTEFLPKGFKEMTKERGRVIKWAPQMEVLAHKSIGGFWTHCGWNSILESICEGVPMLCRPVVGDQMVNSRLVSHVWKVGVHLEGGLGRGNIVKAIKRLMVEKEGMEIKKRAKELKEKVQCALRQGGSSSEFLDKLVHFTLKLDNW